MMPELSLTTLARIRAGHPAYEIFWTGTHWEALARPTATSVHVLAARTLPRLEAELDASAELPPAVRVARAETLTSAVDAILAQRYAGRISAPEAFRRIEAAHREYDSGGMAEVAWLRPAAGSS